MLRSFSNRFATFSQNASKEVRQLSSSSALRHRDDFSVTKTDNGDVACGFKHSDPVTGIEHLKKLQASTGEIFLESEIVVGEDNRTELLFSAKKYKCTHWPLDEVVQSVVDDMPKIEDNKFRKRS